MLASEMPFVNQLNRPCFRPAGKPPRRVSFLLVPALPMFLLLNGGWQESDLRWLYLCGGLATLLTNPLVGRLADRFNKLLVFRALVLLTMVPIVLVTNWGPAPLGVTLLLTTALFVCGGGQLVPATALVTSCAPSACRAGFLSVNAAVQQLAIGLAALLAGALLRQPGPGLPVEHYPLVGLLACVMGVLSLFLVGPYVKPAASQPRAGSRPLAGTSRAPIFHGNRASRGTQESSGGLAVAST